MLYQFPLKHFQHKKWLWLIVGVITVYCYNLSLSFYFWFILHDSNVITMKYIDPANTRKNIFSISGVLLFRFNITRKKIPKVTNKAKGWNFLIIVNDIPIPSIHHVFCVSYVDCVYINLNKITGKYQLKLRKYHHCVFAKSPFFLNLFSFTKKYRITSN